MVKPLKLGHLVLSVRDCARARDFYTERLGMKISSEKLERGQVFLTIGDEHHVLALFQRATEDPPTPDQPGIRHIAFELDDFEALQNAYDELTSAGVAIENASEDGITRSLYIRDPDNNCIELFCNRADNSFETIRTADLTARPLDIAAVSEGQTMTEVKKLGHVMLHVSDAQASKDFYTRMLGVTVSAESADGKTIYLSLGDQHHDLALAEGATGPRPSAKQPGLVHFAWQVDDYEALKAAYYELRAKGFTIKHTFQHNITDSIYLEDPDGMLVELYCNRWDNGLEAMQTMGPRTDDLDIDTRVATPRPPAR